MAWQVYRKHFLLCETVPLFPGPYPGVRRSRRRKPGPRSLGTAAHQGKAQAVEVLSTEEQARFTECLRHLCDPIRPRAETRRTQAHPVPRGGFHKAGEGPAFGDSFPDFSSGRNRAQRSVPARLASLMPGWLDGQSLRHGLRRATSLYTREALRLATHGTHACEKVNLSTKKVEEPSIGSSTSLILRIGCAQS